MNKLSIWTPIVLSAILLGLSVWLIISLMRKPTHELPYRIYCAVDIKTGKPTAIRGERGFSEGSIVPVCGDIITDRGCGDQTRMYKISSSNDLRNICNSCTVNDIHYVNPRDYQIALTEDSTYIFDDTTLIGVIPSYYDSSKRSMLDSVIMQDCQ